MRKHLIIDETLRAGVYSAELFFAGSRAATAVKTQGGVALSENAVPPQYAGFFPQVEVAAMLGDYDAARREKIRGTKKF